MAHALRGLWLVVTAAALLGAKPSGAVASTVVLVPAGPDDTFELRGVELRGAAAIDVTVTYDAAVLARPSAAVGPLLAGAMSAVNVDAPGVIRIVAVRTTPVRGTGVLATIAFARKRSGDGVRSVRARLADLDGKPLEVRAGVRRAEPRGP